MQLSIIIVNYKSADLIIDCIQSIIQQTTAIQYEVIVVDNDSRDNSEQILTSRFPQVRFIQMSYNAGFARANNAGIRQSGGTTVLLLNPDTIIENRAIEQCYRQFAGSGYVACGVQLLNPDRTPQISGNFFITGSLNNLLPLPYIGNFIKWLGNRAGARKPNIPEAVLETPVDWVNGAYLMVKKEAIDKAGLMDEDFFLYAEEVEWCVRLGKIGRLCIYGQYTIIHLQGETANKTFGSSGKGYYNLYDKKGLQIMLSNFVRIRKHLGIGWFFVHLLAYTTAIPVLLVGGLIQQLMKWQNPFKVFGPVVSLAMNVARLWSFAPRIVGGKPYFYKVL